MQWLNANRLSLNIDKTNLMISRPRGKNEVCPIIHIWGAEIQKVDSATFMGIMIDIKFNWMEHIKCISRKIAKGIGIIIKARNLFESETLLNLYNALIFPHISYGIQVWGQLPLLIYIDFMFYRKILFVLSLGTSSLGYELYELYWVRVILGICDYHLIYCNSQTVEYELSWVRVVLGTSCLGYELSWVRVVLCTSCIGYELSRVRVVLGTSCPR